MTNKTAAKTNTPVMPEAAEEHWMFMEEACDTIKKSRFTVSKMIKEKILEKMKEGNRVLISRASVARWMKRYQPGQQTVTKSSAKRKASR